MAKIMNRTNKFNKEETQELKTILDTPDIEAEENVSCPNIELNKEVKEETVHSPRKYEASDGILCKSITSGGLYMKGIKSQILYEWSDNGDVTEVEYQDLVAAIRSNASYVMKPYFIIEDEEVIRQFPQINKVYESMYSIKDLKEVLLYLSPRDMKETILRLPEGAKESIKHIASQMISNGTLDSVQKIKILDEIFSTRLMLMTELFS